MSWTGNVPPRRYIVKTTYEDGKLVRQQTEAHDAGGGMSLTEVRCTCEWPTMGCTLHHKMPDEEGT